MNKNDLSKKMYQKNFDDLCPDRKKIVLKMNEIEELTKKEDFAKVSSASFNFCRYFVAILLWTAFIFKLKFILILIFILMFPSAIFGIKKAPLIVFYDKTFGKIFKSKNEFLSIGAMRFAHSLCSLFSFICILFLYFENERIGWIFVGVFAIIKTISSVGFCPASKLYSCATSGGSCCSFLKKK